MSQIQILLNDSPHSIEESCTLSNALALWNYDSQSIAVALNEVFIPRQNYENQVLHDKDRLEVVTPYAGG